MADVLMDLIQVLKLKKRQEGISRQELEFFSDCRSQAIKGFTVGCSIATGFVWVASRKLNTFLRFNLAGGAGFMTGMWRFNESINSCLDNILAMEGSRLQDELRKIMLEKYGNNPQKMKVFSKHFYSEEVFSDSNHEHPKSIYRLRNLYRDEERVADSKTYGPLDAGKYNVRRSQSNMESSSLEQKRPVVSMRQAQMNPHVIMEEYGDPLKVLFGFSQENEESRTVDDFIANSSKLQSRSERRAHRRHRMRQRHGDSFTGEGIASKL